MTLRSCNSILQWASLWGLGNGSECARRGWAPWCCSGLKRGRRRRMVPHASTCQNWAVHVRHCGGR
uniref:Secreted protein n=1 Tax=Arundo donax TaxID=35708 RepID=A0A0A8YR03_ARUDO